MIYIVVFFVLPWRCAMRVDILHGTMDCWSIRIRAPHLRLARFHCIVPRHKWMSERGGRKLMLNYWNENDTCVKMEKEKKKKLQTKSEYKRDDTQFTWQRSIGIRLKVRGHKYCRKLFRRRTPPASNESTIYVHSHILCVFHYPSACDSYVPMALCSVVRIVRIYRMCVCVSIIASYRHGARCTYNVDCA